MSRQDRNVDTPESKYLELSWSQRTLVFVFLAVGVWYLGWRTTTFNPESPVFSLLIYGAEAFGFVCALLYLVMCWKLQPRSSLPVQDGTTADVFIPTINESEDIVRRTAMAALRMQHVGDVWLLDDGNRPAMRRLAAELGCRYIARTENSHAKAGNLNNALKQTQAKFIAIFDADHAPAPTFLARTLGFFSDTRVAFVQTPQDFYNLDSFQHRLRYGESLVWSEQSLFFRVIQPGKDRLNAAFFCGSCAVVRRAAIDDIGGFATETVTEDLHTSLKLHKRGWRSVYYRQSLAFGLAPSSLIPFLKQRLRWGQGAMQVWRQEGILFTRGLTAGQRVCYMATILAYFEGWQRAIFFLAPVIVLTTGILPIRTFDLQFLVHFIPYYLLTFWVFEEVARGYGRSLLTEQYNMIRFAVFMAATTGLFLRKLRFVVTPKKMGEAGATHTSLWPQYAVLAMNAVAIPFGIFLYLTQQRMPLSALVANVLWASITFGLAAFVIGFAHRVAAFRRREYRFPLPVPVRIAGETGSGFGLATDISPAGFRLTGVPATGVRIGQQLQGELLLPSGPLPMQATVRTLMMRESEDGNFAAQRAAGCELEWPTVDGRNQLEMFLFGSDLQWRLNGLMDRVRTPLERLSDWLAGRRVDAPKLVHQRWQPLLFPEGQGLGTGVGFISVPADGRARTIVSVGELPHPGGLLEGQELTTTGLRRVQGELAVATVLEAQGTPIHLYRLSA